MSTVESTAPEHEISNPVEECKKVSLLTLSKLTPPVLCTGHHRKGVPQLPKEEASEGEKWRRVSTDVVLTFDGVKEVDVCGFEERCRHLLPVQPGREQLQYVLLGCVCCFGVTAPNRKKYAGAETIRMWTEGMVF